jgi:hypothetical protein
MKLLDLFEEYIILQYPSSEKLRMKLDVALGDFQLARFSDFYCEVFFLTTGESLKIEKELLRLCSGFYKSRGEEIVRAEDTKDSALWELVVICFRIMSGNSINPRQLKDTEELRKWIKEKTGYNFGPLLYFSKEQTIKL